MFNRSELKRSFGKAADLIKADLHSIENRLETELPEEVVEFLKDFNGSEADAEYVVDISKTETTTFSHFYSAYEIIEAMSLPRFLDRALLPITHDAFGNDIVLKAADGFSVYFCDNDEPRPNIKIADKIGDLLKGLKVDDLDIPHEVLRQVKVTENPDFEKNVRELEARLGKKLL